MIAELGFLVPRTAVGLGPWGYTYIYIYICMYTYYFMHGGISIIAHLPGGRG